MRLTAKDEAGQPVVFDADPERVQHFTHFLRANPGIVGPGTGASYGKTSAKDATEAEAFAVSQLAYSETTIYARQYAPLMFEKLLPNVISYAAGEWAQSVEYTITDGAGMGKRISYGSNDIPFADVAYARKSIPVAYGGMGYFYNQEELRTSAYLQRPLPTVKMNEAMQGYRRHLNAVALIGEGASNFTGLFNNPSVTVNIAPANTGGVANGVWTAAAKTPDQIIQDVVTMVSAVQQATQNNSMPTHLAVPIDRYAVLLKPRSTTTDTSILQFIEKMYPGITVDPVFELSTIGTGGTTTARAVMWNPDNDNMVLHVPMALRFLPPQPDILRVVIPGEYKYAGLEVRRVSTVYYMDNV